MTERLVECVPNFSEGRDLKKIDAILAAVREVDGVEVLDVDPGAETNRTVVTLLGPPEPIAEAAFRAIAKAAEVIDMSLHHGAHPRHGATDVCPFVPVAGLTMEDCVAIANWPVGWASALAKNWASGSTFTISAAQRRERLRRTWPTYAQGEYEGAASRSVARMRVGGRTSARPSFNEQAVGVATIGAREFLIAYNINLNTAHQGCTPTTSPGSSGRRAAR